ncbi:MAG: AAA family ATPase [Burkholderiaceae bacterium]
MIEIRFLGALSIVIDGHAVAALSSRGVSLLARLLLDGRGNPLLRSALAQSLWPDSDLAQARTNLRRELHGLRRAHACLDAAIQADAKSVAWVMPDGADFDIDSLAVALAQIDQVPHAEPLRQLACRLLALERGELLAGLNDSWVIERRRELQAELDLGFESLAVRLQGAGEAALALRLGERWLRRDPVCEPAYRLAMWAHAELGSRAGLAATWRRCRQQLRDELGVDPDAQTKALFRRLQTGATGAATGWSDKPVSLAGRGDVWQVLSERWRALADGAHLVVLTGEPGAGKTALASAFADAVRSDGGMALAARAFSAAGLMPFAPIRDWLSHDAMRDALAGLSAAQREILDRVLLAADDPGRAPDAAAPGPGARKALFDTIAAAIDGAGMPLLLLLDDLQWCDEDSLQAVLYLFERAARLPVLLICTLREFEAGCDSLALRLIDLLSAGGQLTSVGLPGLSLDETHELVDRVSRDLDSALLEEPEVERIHRQSGGNPLFAIELARSLARFGSQGPGVSARLDGMIRQRVAVLPESVRQLACLAAVTGGEFTESVLERATGDSERVIDGLDQLWRAGLVTDLGGGRYMFAHDCVRESIYAGLGPAQRRQLHRSIGAALLLGERALSVCGEIAHHCEMSGAHDEALPWIVRAAEAATQSLACRETIRLARRGLLLLDTLPDEPGHQRTRLQLLLSMGHASLTSDGYAGDQMREIRDQIEATLPRIDDERIRFMAVERLRHYYGNRHTIRALALAGELVTIADRLGSDEHRISARRSLAFSQFQMGAFRECIESAGAACAIGRDALAHRRLDARRPTVHLAIVSGLLAGALWMSGRCHESDQQLSESQALPMEHMRPDSQAYVRHFRVLNAMLRDDVEAVRPHLSWFRQINRHDPLPVTSLLEADYSSWLRGRAGEFDAAIDQQMVSITIASEKGLGMLQPQRFAWLARWQREASRADDALASIGQGLTTAERLNERFWDAELHRLRALVLADLGHPSVEVLAQFDLAERTAIGQHAVQLQLRVVASRAGYLASLGERRAALSALRPLIVRYDDCRPMQEFAILLELAGAIATEEAGRM